MDLHLASLSTRATKTDFAIICYHFTNKNRPQLPNPSESLKAFFELKRHRQMQSVHSQLTHQAAASSAGEGRGVRPVPALSSTQTRLPAHGRVWLPLSSSCSSILGTAATPGSAAARSPRGRSATHLPGRAGLSPEPGRLWGRRLQLAACGAAHLAAQPAPRAALPRPRSLSGLLPPAESSACEIAARS